MDNSTIISKSKHFIVMTLILIFIIPVLAQDPTVGLIYNDVTKAQPGYTLFQNRNGTNVYLIDNEGRLVHQWNTDYVSSATAYLLENGNLLRATKLEDPNGGNGGFQVLDWDGNVIWEYIYGSQNHDIEPGPNGNVFMITNDKIGNADAIAAGGDPTLITGNLVSLKILEIHNNNGTGEIFWEWNAWEHIVQDFDQSKPNYDIVADHPELIDLNYIPTPNEKWLHHNSIDYNEDLDQIMVSIRSYNEFWILDHSTSIAEAATHEGGARGMGGDILYRWGNPASYRAGTVDDQMLFGQHDASWVKAGLPEDGNITVFNNGLNRPEGAYSTAIEITPPPINNLGLYEFVPGIAYAPDELTWVYTAPTPTDMFASSYGGMQRLPNGNTLICSSHDGDFIEVTSAKEVVWQYTNPVMKNDTLLEQGDEPKDNEAYRCTKYSTDYPGLAGKDLTPGDPLELYTDTDGDGITDGYDNCPDTINPGQEDTDGDGIGNECDPYPLGTEDSEGTVEVFKLEQNYPNPFNPITSIEFNLIEDSFITLTIYDLVGNKVRTLINDHMGQGFHNIAWDAHDDNGNPVSSGIYLYSINAGQQNQTKKMMLLR